MADLKQSNYRDLLPRVLIRADRSLNTIFLIILLASKCSHFYLKYKLCLNMVYITVNIRFPDPTCCSTCICDITCENQVFLTEISCPIMKIIEKECDFYILLYVIILIIYYILFMYLLYIIYVFTPNQSKVMLIQRSLVLN